MVLNKKIKFKILRLINTGVVNAEHFSEVKNIQLYNTFLFLGSFVILIYGILLSLYQFYINALFTFIAIIFVFFCFFLNKKNKVLQSKFFLMQFISLNTIVNLMIFTYKSVFTLYFFLIILYATIVFNDRETKYKYFFIIQNFIMLILVLTPLRIYLYDLHLIHEENLKTLNFISIIVFILFLFIHIFFQTLFQSYKEDRYNRANNRLFNDNNKIRIENIRKKMTVAINANLMSIYLEKYNNWFSYFASATKNTNYKETNQIEKYNNLRAINEKIEDLLNFQFERQNQTKFLKYELFEIHELTQELLSSQKQNATISKQKPIQLYIHKDLYASFLKIVLEKFNPSNKNITITIKKNTIPKKIFELNKKIIEIYGIYIHFFIDSKVGNPKLDFYFFYDPNEVSFYKYSND